MSPADPDTDVHAALALLDQERYRAAAAALANLPETPLTLWKRGAALAGLNAFAPALAALERAHAALTDPLERARCALDLALAQIRASRVAEAATTLAACRPVFAAGAELDALRAELAELLRRHRAGDHAGYLAAYRPITEALLRQGDRRWAAYALAQAALAHRMLDALSACDTVAREGLALAEALGLVYRQAHLCYSLAVTASNRNDFPAMRHWLERARAAVTESGGALLQGDILLLDAQARYVFGDLEDCIRQHGQALAIYEEHGYVAGVGQQHVNIGLALYARGDLHGAGARYRTAEQVGRSAGDPHVIAHALIGQGAVLTLLGDLPGARDRFLAAHALAEPAGLRGPTMIGLAFAAAVCPRAEVAALTQRALDAFAKNEPSNNRSAALRVLGERLLREGDHAGALPLLQEAEQQQRHYPLQWAMTAVRVAEAELASLANDGLSGAAALRARLNEIEAVAADLPEIRVRAALVGSALATRTGDMTGALLHLQQAVAALRVIRASGDDPVMASFSARPYEAVYRRGLALAGELGDAGAALGFSEHRRAQWLTHGLTAQTGRPAARPELDELSRLLRRRRAMAERLHTPGAEIDPEGLAALRRATEEVERRYATLDAQTMFDPAHAGTLRDSRPLAGPAGLRAAFSAAFGPAWAAVSLDPLDETGERWELIRLTGDTLTARVLEAGTDERPLLRALAAKDPAFRRRFFGEARVRDRALARLSDWLGASAWAQDTPTPSTLLIADAAGLAAFPFAALPIGSDARLGERAILRFAPSLNVAALLCARPAPAPGRQALIVCPLDFEGRHRPLPESAAEVAAVAEAWPGATVLRGEHATLGALRGLADQGALARFDRLYFATHGIADGEHARMSGLALRDGDLTLQEILGWSLDARLVVVAACEGAFHVDAGGEERIGLETALLAAGARATLSARWPVADAAAAILLPRIAHGFATHGDAALALHHAGQACAGALPDADRLAWRVLGHG